MQPFVTADGVKDTYWRYIETSYPIRSDALREQFRRLVEEEQLLWQEPFISLARPFESGGTFANLIADGVLDPRITTAHWGFDELWQHQAEAVRRLSTYNSPRLRGEPEEGRNTIVATGTGSGKTESFLIPVVDDCLRNPEPRGVRAIIVYPMNALANDQLERLRRLLAGTGVTFGRYTGDTPFNTNDAQDRGIPRPSNSPDEERYTREEIQKNPPQILITNYVMLELLLLRKDDQEIFHGVKPRYLVLDEVHTYTGILGAEVACLIRRLKEHAGLRPGELICVGTSATIIGDDQTDGRSRLIEFATELFAEPFYDGAVVEEAYEAIAWPEVELEPAPELDAAELAGVNPEDPEDVRRLARTALEINIDAESELVFEALYEAIAERRAFAEVVLVDPEQWVRNAGAGSAA